MAAYIPLAESESASISIFVVSCVEANLFNGPLKEMSMYVCQT